MQATAIARSARGATLHLDEIQLPATARPYNATAVTDLARSIQMIGLQSAPTVIERDGEYVLVAGRHRIEALRVLGIDSVLVRVVDFNDFEARLWSISENLHRAELTVAQRAEHVAEYASIVKEKHEAAQLGHPDKRYEKRGDAQASRDLGLTRQEVQRAQTIASLHAETKEAARSLGYDDNQAALLAAAKADTSERQIGVLNSIAERGSVAGLKAPPRSSDAEVIQFGVSGNAVPAAVRPLRNLENISGGELARWIKITTPNDRQHVIRVLETAATILRDEFEGRVVA